MLRGLALRQGLFMVNGLLVLVLVLVLFFAGRELIRGKVKTGPVSAPTLSRAAAPLLDKSAHPRDYYKALETRGLFDDAGKLKRGSKPDEPPPPPTTAAQETSLPLKLFGTTLTSGPHPLSAAIIEVREGGTLVKTYYPKDEIIENVFLKEVRPQEVILDNKRTQKTESLRIVWASDVGRPPAPGARQAAVPPTAAPAVGSRVNLVTLDRADISKKLEDEYARVASTLNVKVVNDDNGHAKGITTDNIENFEVAKELGLKNGDILVSLNNEPVDSKDRAIEVLQKYKSASLFRVGIQRDGAMQYLTYRVR